MKVAYPGRAFLWACGARHDFRCCHDQRGERQAGYEDATSAEPLSAAIAYFRSSCSAA